MTADQIKVADFVPGTRCKIKDAEHQYAGCSGTLEFTQAGAAWLRIIVNGTPVDVTVSLSKLEVLPVRRVA